MPPEGADAAGLPVVIVGAGRVGASIAIDLARARRDGAAPGAARGGLRRLSPITVVCRSDPGPTRSSRLTALDIALVRADPATGVPEAVLGGTGGPGAEGLALLFCVTDDRLVETAATWAAACLEGRAPCPRVALHTSGLHDASALAPLEGAGAAVAACHPLVAIASPGNGRFRGVTFGIDGDPEAVTLATGLVRLLGGRPCAIRPEARPLYHLAAVFGSNFLVACVSVAAELLSGSAEELDDRGALGALLPLARSALDNLEREGLPEGMTGPIARGDVGTVERHLLALDPVRRDLYRALGTELLAAQEDRLGAEVAARLRGVLGPGGGDDEESEGGAADGE